MRPTFMGFESSRSALYTSQKALDIVGHNLANIASEGYTRQRADQVAIDVYAYKNRLSVNSLNYTGMGATVEGVSQVRDERADISFRNSYSETSYYGKSNDMFGEIENILSELDEGVDGNGYGLGWGIEQMYKSLEDIVTNVNIAGDAAVFQEAVNNMTGLLNRVSNQLTESCEAFKKELTVQVNDANTILEDIAQLNKNIKEIIITNGYTEQYGPNELIDKRNVLLDELSAFGKVKAENNKDGTINVFFNDHECVTGVNADKFMYQDNTDGTVSVKWKTNSENAVLQDGILKASAEIINGRGNNISGSDESTVRGYRYYQDCLDTFAVKIADVLNNTLPASFDAEGNVTSYKKLVGQSAVENGERKVYPERKVSASNITLSDDFNADPSYIYYDRNSCDSTYFLELIGKLSTNKQTFINGVETYKGTFSDYITEYTGKIGGDKFYAGYKYEATEKISDELQNFRENVMAVSETDETVSMLTYNRAFQAAAKIMTTFDEMLDVIVNQVGALG